MTRPGNKPLRTERSIVAAAPDCQQEPYSAGHSLLGYVRLLKG
jgi:hypothetical protein